MMIELMEPFGTQIDLHTGIFQPPKHMIQRKLSHMRGMFVDDVAAAKILAEEGDRLIYDVHVTDLPEAKGQILHCTTIIYPGCIGSEYHMTKGHFHARREQGEVYLGLAGKGYLVLQSELGEFRAVLMTPGIAAYVPPYWAHRTVNVGTQPFVFFAAWAGEAGHDYGSIERMGFPKLLVRGASGAGVEIIENPRYQKA
jgi:glucose-6-phosphate isomerase